VPPGAELAGIATSLTQDLLETLSTALPLRETGNGDDADALSQDAMVLGEQARTQLRHVRAVTVKPEP
jgi:hypothetical protein